jgi:hypothetical protein
MALAHDRATLGRMADDWEQLAVETERKGKQVG